MCMLSCIDVHWYMLEHTVHWSFTFNIALLRIQPPLFKKKRSQMVITKEIKMTKEEKIPT